ncbi:MAG: ABC transporter substrate-binding protein [Anaeromyxobacteraceae bacterium]
MTRTLLALLLTALSTAAAAEDKPSVIRIGYAGVGAGGRPVAGGGPSSIVTDQGALVNEFKADGIAIKTTYFTGAGPAVNEAIANGQLDFALQGDLPALVAKAGGLPTKLLLAQTRADAIYVNVPAGSPAKSLEDLKGKRIAVFKGTNLQLAFYRVLESRGLKDSDFKLINMSIFDSNAALLSNDIDAQVSGADVFPLVDRGVARIIYSTQGDPKLGRVSHLLVTEKFAAKYPQTVQRVVNVHLKGSAWLADEANRARAYQIWTKSGYGLPSWKGDWDGDILRDRSSPLFDEFYRAQYKRLLKAGRELKLVRRDIDIDAWLDPTWLNRGIATLGLQSLWRELDADGNPKPTKPVVSR